MRMLKLFSAIIMLSLQRELTFRSDLIFRALVSASGVGAGIATLGIVYTQTATLAGWSLGEAFVLFGTYLIVNGVLWAFVEPNVAWFREQVTEGKLDDTLLKPVSSLFLASLGACAPFGLLDVVVGMMIVGIGTWQAGTLPTLWRVLGWLVMLAVGFVMTWASRVLLASVAFWAPSFQSHVLYQAVWQFGRYPVSIYQQPIRFALTYVVPIAFIATFPTHVLTRGANPLLVVGGLAGGTGAIIITHLVWNAALRRYTGATS